MLRWEEHHSDEALPIRGIESWQKYCKRRCLYFFKEFWALGSRRKREATFDTQRVDEE